MPRVLFFLESAFSLWMLVDAIRRGAAYYWYPVILMPFGEWVYFFKVKIHDPELRWLKGAVPLWSEKKPTLDKLRFDLQRSPSFANKLALAQGLHDAEIYGEALKLFAEVLEDDPVSKPGLYGHGLCLVGLKDYEPAIKTLRKLIEVMPAYESYAGWSNLAFALEQSGRREEAVEVLAKLVDTSPRLPHRNLYAYYLSEEGRRDEAREQLMIGLEEYKHAPRFLKRADRSAARQAKQLLQQLSRPE